MELKMNNTRSIALLVGCLLLVITSQTRAGLIFTDVSYTTNSLTFTVNGDMTGYGSAPSQSETFSLRYDADMINDPIPSGTVNTWSNSVFDGKTLADPGFTVFAGNFFTISQYSGGSLAGATATNRTVTVNFGADYLDTTAVDPLVSFNWGNGHHSGNPTLVGTAIASSSAVPEPSSFAFLAIGAFGLIGCRRRRR